MEEENKEKQPVIGLPEVAPEPESTQFLASETDELIEDDLLAQQPLMAALNQAPEQEVLEENTEPVEQSTNPFTQLLPSNEGNISVSMGSEINNSTVKSDDVVNQVDNSSVPSNSMQNNPFVSESTSGVEKTNNQPTVNTTPKKSFLFPIILVALIALVAGGFFLMKHKDLGRENLPKLVYLEETVDYYEDKYDCHFTDVSREDLGHYYQSETENQKVTIEFEEKDGKNVVVGIVFAVPKSFNDVFNMAKPFLTEFDDWKQFENMIDYAKKYTQINYYVDNKEIVFSKFMGNPSISIKMDSLEVDGTKKKDFIYLNSSNEMTFQNDEGKFSYKIIDAFGESPLFSTYVNNASFMRNVVFNYRDDIKVEIDEKEANLSSIIAATNHEQEVRDFNGQQILILKETGHFGDVEIYIPFKNENVDVNSTENKLYLLIRISDFTDGGVSAETIDKVLSNLSRK